MQFFVNFRIVHARNPVCRNVLRNIMPFPHLFHEFVALCSIVILRHRLPQKYSTDSSSSAKLSSGHLMTSIFKHVVDEAPGAAKALNQSGSPQFIEPGGSLTPTQLELLPKLRGGE